MRMLPAVVTDEPAEGVLRVLLNRPERRNALDQGLLETLAAALEGAAARVVVLGSTDAGTFSAGADLDLSNAQRVALTEGLYRVYERVVTMAAPVVAVLGGAAVGAGAQLALAADLRVAGEGARLRFVGAGHGLAVGVWALPLLVGRARALDLCLTTRWVEADEALAMGLLTRVAPDPMAAALRVATEIAGHDAAAVARIKQLTGAPELAARLAAERDANAARGAPPRRAARAAARQRPRRASRRSSASVSMASLMLSELSVVWLVASLRTWWTASWISLVTRS